MSEHDGVPAPAVAVRWTRAVLLGLAVTCLAVPAAHTPARASSPGVGIEVSARSHGLVLTLVLSHREYPADALIRPTVTLRNVSHRTRWVVAGGPPLFSLGTFEVDVFGPTGSKVYPDPVEGVLPPPGPPPFPEALRPGATIRDRPYAILRGGELQAILRWGLFTAGPGGPEQSLATPAVTVALVPAPAPRVVLREQGGVVGARIEPTFPVHGRPVYVDVAHCGTQQFAEQILWTRTSTSLMAGCTDLSYWRAAVGWVGHPVAQIDYEKGTVGTTSSYVSGVSGADPTTCTVWTGQVRRQG